MALQNDLTTSGVRQQIIRFALPLVVSNLLQALYNAVDMFFVGKYTDTAGLAAVSVSGPIMNIMLMTINGLSIGASVMIGIYKGQGDQENLKKAANTVIAIYALLAAAVAVGGALFTPALIQLVHTPEASVGSAIQYLRTIFIGIVFMFGYNLISAFQRGFGDSKSSMVFVIIAACANVVLDFLFIVWGGMGAFGAALATVMAQGISFIMGVAYFRRKKHVINFSPRAIRIYPGYAGKLFHLGLPAALQQFLLNVSLTTLSGIANSFGLEASAAYGVCIKIESFAFLPSDAINASLSAFVSQNLGARKPERALSGLRNALGLSLSLAAVLAVVTAFAAPYAASLFNKDPEVIRYVSGYLRVSCFSFLCFAAAHPLIGFLRGTGNGIVTLFCVCISQYVVRIPAAMLATRRMGFNGVAVASILGPLSAVCLYSLFVASGGWKRSREARLALAKEGEGRTE